MRRKKHRRKAGRVVLTILLILALLAVIVIFGFRTRSIQVEGNDYYSDTSITTWVENDELSVNTLYILIKYNLTDASLPSAIESMKASLKNPWTVSMAVREKDMLGYVDYDNAYLYFDQDGMASLRTKKVIEGVPYIEGLEFDTGGVKIGEGLPVEDESIFGKIVEVSKYLEKYSLAPDRLVCGENGITVYFGNVEVMLGEENYEDRLAQAEVILEKLKESYPDTAGTLHLENYDASSSAISFVPE